MDIYRRRRAIRRSVQLYLERDEELLAGVVTNFLGAGNASLGGAASMVSAQMDSEGHAKEVRERLGFELDSQMIVAVTSRRLLLFKSRGYNGAKAKKLLGAVPLDDVDRIDVSTIRVSKAVILVLRGHPVLLETARADPAESLPVALAQARSLAHHSRETG